MNRRGSIYLLVLLTSAFVLASGLAALSLEERAHKRADLSAEVGSARSAMRSGLDLAMQHLSDNPNWRDGVGGNDRVLETIINTGGWEHTVRVYAEDPDGNLVENLTDPFILSIRSSRARSSRRLSVELVPTQIPMDVLELGVYSGMVISCAKLSNVLGDSPIGSGGNVEAAEASFTVPAEGEGIVTVGITSEVTVSGASPREIPMTDLVAAYSALGPLIAEATMTKVKGSYILDGLVVGPGLNPLGDGSTSPNGVYVIDQGSTPLVIRNSRIVGTLVFLGTGSVEIEGSVNWEPATTGAPALLTNGPVILDMLSAPLSESVVMVNFNPVGLGDGRLGDGDITDEYASEIRGILHTQDIVTVNAGENKIIGTLIAMNSIVVNSGATLELVSTRDSVDNPPPGFVSSLGFQMLPVQWLDP